MYVGKLNQLCLGMGKGDCRWLKSVPTRGLAFRLGTRAGYCRLQATGECAPIAMAAGLAWKSRRLQATEWSRSFMGVLPADRHDMRRQGRTRESVEASTGIEPVYTDLQSAA